LQLVTIVVFDPAVNLVVRASRLHRARKTPAPQFPASFGDGPFAKCLTAPAGNTTLSTENYQTMSISRTLPILESRECACEGGSLDKLIQPAILVVLSKGPLHGYRLAEQIGQSPMFGGQKPDVSGIYRFLKAMERQGMVEASWDLAKRGPAKKSYQITSAGQLCLERWINTLEHHRRGITELLRAARAAVGPRNGPR
jgi:PadR family transcriptional regulator, regulatory protein PadR